MQHDIIEFDREIRITIPKKNLMKLFYERRRITAHEYYEIHKFARKIELIQARLEHVHSIVECILLRR